MTAESIFAHCPDCGGLDLYVREAAGDRVDGLAWAVLACLVCGYTVRVRPDRDAPAGGE